MNLENLDTLIGFTLVMLLLSLLVTTLVQLAGGILGLRGKNLLWGVGRVLDQLGLPNADAKKLATQILQHESIRPNVLARFPNLLARYASAIHFDEFWAIFKTLPAGGNTPPAELTALVDALPASTQEAVKQQLTALSNLLTKARAAVTDANTNARFWFDTVMDRTTERFVLHTRIVTAFFALALAFGAQIDSLAIIKQLSQRPDLRAKLVAMTEPVSKEAEGLIKPPAAPKPAPDPAAAPDGEAEKAKVEKLLAQVGTIQKDLAQTSLQLLPAPFTYAGYGSRFFGMFMTALFLGLGAPFWFNALRQLANLRPTIAKKVDDAKVEDKDKARTEGP